MRLKLPNSPTGISSRHDLTYRCERDAGKRQRRPLNCHLHPDAAAAPPRPASLRPVRGPRGTPLREEGRSCHCSTGSSKNQARHHGNLSSRSRSPITDTSRSLTSREPLFYEHPVARTVSGWKNRWPRPSHSTIEMHFKSCWRVDSFKEHTQRVTEPADS